MADDVLKFLVSVNTKGEPKIKALNKDLKKLSSQSKKTDKSVRSMGKGFSSIVSPIAAVTAGATALYAAFSSLKTFAAFDDTMRMVGAVSNATAGELQQLTDLAKEMGSETRFSASEAAEGLKFLGMAGLDVEQQMTALPGVLNLASAGALDLGAAADIATNILTGYGLKVEDLGMVNDVLAKTFTSSNTNLQELGHAFTYAGSVAKSAGQDFTEIAASLGLLANAGFKGEMGGTALRGAMTRLLKPTNAAAGIISKLSLQITDSTDKMRPFLDIVDDLGRSGASTADLMEIFGLRAGPGVAALIQQGSDAIVNMRATVADYAGTTDRIAAQMEAGIGGQLRALNSAFEALKISTGEAIAGALLDDVQNLTTFLRENKDGLRGFAVAFVSVVAALVSGGIALSDFIAKRKGFFEFVAIATAGAIAYTVAILALNAATVLLATSSVVLSTALKASLAGAMLASIATIVKATYEFNEMRKAQDEAADAAIRGATGMTNYKTKLASATIASGHSVTTLQEMVDAIQAGEIAWDEAGQSFVKGSEKQQGAVDDNKAAIDGWIKEIETLQDSHNQTYKTIEKVTGGALKEMQGNWDKLKKKIVEYDDAIEKTGRETANVLFELSQKGKAPIEQWNAQKDAAGRLSEEIRGLIEEGRKYAAAGNLKGAEKSWKEAAELGKNLMGVYKGLATEVKAVWTPAMEASHKSASEGVKKYGQDAEKALSESKKHYKSAEDAAKSFGDRQLDLKDKIAAIGRKQSEAAAEASGSMKAMASAARSSYNSMVSAAKEYERKSREALAAGDTEAALAFADRAMSAWDALGNEVEVDGKKVISATKALRDQASGVKSAGDAAIAALKAKEAAEIAAGKAADDAAKKATAAKEAEAQKVAELEKKKSEIVKSEAEATKEAMKGVAEAGGLITESQNAMSEAVKLASDELNKQSGFQLGEMYTEAGEKAQELNELQQTHNILVNETEIDWGNVWDAMQNGAEDAFDAVDVEIQQTEAELENLTRPREVTITIKEVTGASGGTSVGVSGASSGASIGKLGPYSVRNGKAGRSLYGFGGGDTLKNLFALENGEQVVNKHSVRKFGGWDMAQAYNDGDEVRVADALFKQFPHLAINIPAVPQVSAGISVQRETIYQTTIIDQASGVEFARQYKSAEGQRLDREREERIKKSFDRFKF